MISVLVVDDNPVVLEFFYKTLGSLYNVYAADNGSEALGILETLGDEIELAIIDAEMTFINGWEALQIIRDSRNGFENLKVIMTTTSDLPEHALKAWMNGVSFFITKPLASETIKSCVSSALCDPIPPEFV